MFTLFDGDAWRRLTDAYGATDVARPRMRSAPLRLDDQPLGAKLGADERGLSLSRRWPIFHRRPYATIPWEDLSGEFVTSPRRSLRLSARRLPGSSLHVSQSTAGWFLASSSGRFGLDSDDSTRSLLVEAHSGTWDRFWMRVFTGITAILVVTWLVEFADWIEMRERAVETTGVVVDVAREEFPIVEFETAEGVTVRFEVQAGSGEAVGERVPVLYDPKGRRRPRIEGELGFRLAMIALLAAIFFYAAPSQLRVRRHADRVIQAYAAPRGIDLSGTKGWP